MKPVFDINGAIKKLGVIHVVTYRQHLATFGRIWPQDVPVWVPSAEQIAECAEQNAAGTNKWVLGFGSTLSFREQHSILGTDTNHKHNFYPGVDWFLEPEYREVGDSHPIAGYYLLDMTPRWNYTNWQTQGANITALGEDNERTDERIFSQVVLAHQKATGQRLFNGQRHWGRILDSNRFRVCVRLNPDGLRVGGGLPSYDDSDDLFVSVARKSACRALIA